MPQSSTRARRRAPLLQRLRHHRSELVNGCRSQDTCETLLHRATEQLVPSSCVLRLPSHLHPLVSPPPARAILCPRPRSTHSRCFSEHTGHPDHIISGVYGPAPLAVFAVYTARPATESRVQQHHVRPRPEEPFRGKHCPFILIRAFSILYHRVLYHVGVRVPLHPRPSPLRLWLEALPSPSTYGPSETDMTLTYAPLVLPQPALTPAQYHKRVLVFVNATRPFVRLDTSARQTVRERVSRQPSKPSACPTSHD